MFCEYCHAEISPSHRECPICKKPVRAVHSSCPNCSADLGTDAVCCNNCGYHLLLKKVIKLHETGGAPPPQTTMLCGKCGKTIPVSSRFCEFCGADVRREQSAPLASPTPSDRAQKTTSPPGGGLGFNEATFNALIKVLDAKGVISIEDLRTSIGQ